MIPIQPPPQWFKSLNSIITKFYWKNKTPRIKLETLGGLQAPHFAHYFIAHQFQYIYKWTHPTVPDTSWTDIEQTFCKDIYISDLPFLSPSIKHHPCFKNPTKETILTA